MIGADIVDSEPVGAPGEHAPDLQSGRSQDRGRNVGRNRDEFVHLVSPLLDQRRLEDVSTH